MRLVHACSGARWIAGPSVQSERNVATTIFNEKINVAINVKIVIYDKRLGTEIEMHAR